MPHWRWWNIGPLPARSDIFGGGWRIWNPLKLAEDGLAALGFEHGKADACGPTTVYDADGDWQGKVQRVQHAPQHAERLEGFGGASHNSF
jgi:hypothetical protein